MSNPHNHSKVETTKKPIVVHHLDAFSLNISNSLSTIHLELEQAVCFPLPLFTETLYSNYSQPLTFSLPLIQSPCQTPRWL